MEQINSLLNLPEYATASDRACAVYNLMQQHDNIQAARATAEHELMALRSATSHIFAESICAARGITDADAQEDIRAAWCEDPYAALNALAGDNITASNPYGCNQYGHEWRGKHGEGWQPSSKYSNNGKQNSSSKVSSLTDEINKTMKEIDEAGDKAALPNGKVDKAQSDKVHQLRTKLYQELSPKLKKLKEDKNLSDADRKKISDTQKKLEEHSKPKLRTTTTEERRGWSSTSGKKRLSDALKKLAPRTDKNGQGLMPFAGNKSNNMSDSLKKSLTNDIYEIALEEGGYESLYDAPKDKLKAAIMKELQATPKEEADKLGDDTSDSYKWWRKRKEKIAKSLES